MDERRKLALDSIAIHADDPFNSTPAVSPPIWQTSTFGADSEEEFADMANRPRHDRFYTRYGNPTHTQTAAVVAQLEGAEAAMLSSSGMGAITATIMAHVSAGDHVVAQESLYAGTAGLLRSLLPRFGVEATFVDQAEPAQFEQAVRPNTRVIVVETPSNPLMRITDLAAVAAIAKGIGAVTVADNTFATPINQRPLEFGIDLVVHSATKYLGGHSDLLAGVVTGTSEAIEKIWHAAVILGSCSSPFDAWLMLRGLRTLGVRVERHNRSAQAIAEALSAHRAIAVVHYAGLDSHPQHALAASQMSGFGGVVSFEMKGGYAAAEALLSRVRLARRAASLGGVETLLVHPAAMWASAMSPEELAAAGVSGGLVRLSVGLEDAGDLIDDLSQALARLNSD